LRESNPVSAAPLAAAAPESGTAPMREGARRPSSARIPPPSPCPPPSLAFSLALRNGRSWDVTKPSRTGRNISEVSVWAEVSAAAKTISTGHARAARKAIARLRRPVAGPGVTIGIPHQFHTLDVPFQNRAGLLENVVNGVKTIMVNGRLRQG